jgi:[protein-PII] uridylyltransferase
VLWEERIDLQGARISTIGERAEDVFYITDTSQRPLDNITSEQLKNKLIAALTRTV